MHRALHLAARGDGQFHQGARLVRQRTRFRGRGAERIVCLENLGILFFETGGSVLAICLDQECVIVCLQP